MASRLVAEGIDLNALHPSAKGLLQGILDRTNLPQVSLSSGHRDEAHNKAVGGAKHSTHIEGKALDIDISGYTDAQKKEILQAAIDSGARGVGIYPSGNSLHIDTRQSATLWGLKPGATYAAMDHSNAPGWAKEPLAKLFGTGASGAPPNIQTAINEAAARFGVDPNVMTAIARRETVGFDANARNPNSSASGLFQIIDKTWKDGVAKYGQAIGMPETATPFDPKWSSMLAAALVKENTLVIKSMTGRDATGGELYLAHFLGGGKAVDMIRANETNPTAPAAAMFPGEAAANPKIFYDKEGMPKPISEVYAHMTTIDTSPASGAAPGASAPDQAPDKPKTSDDKTMADAPTFTPAKAIAPAVQRVTGGPQLESETDRVAARLGVKRGLMG